MMKRRKQRRRAFDASVVLSVVLFSPGVLAGAQGSVSPGGGGSSPALELQAVCESLVEGQNSYFSRTFAAELRRRLSASGGDPALEAGTRGLLAKELLKLDEPAEAVELLAAGLRLAREHELDPGLRSSLHWYLALAHLQLAEDENCVARHTAQSCILPIGPEGIHSLKTHVRKAGDLFLDYIREHPRNLQAVWLLNLARRLSGDFPHGLPAQLRLPEKALTSPVAFPHWLDRAPELGVNRVDLAGGAVMDDFDGDGHLDVVTSTWDPCDGVKALRNDGRGGFDDVTGAWGLDGQLGGLNLVQADYDNDGRLDLLVLRGAWLLAEGRMRNSLLRNGLDGSGGRFTDVTARAGLAQESYPTQTADWADYDGDGDLDLFVGNEASKALAYPSQLYRNRGNGTFEEVAAQAGVENFRYAKGVAWGDYDDDGDPDLYVSNFGPNRLYRNNGDGTFSDVAPELGLTAPERESFATWFFDFDNDGDLDLFVADYRSQAVRVTASYFGMDFPDGQPLLYRNDAGRFMEVSRQVGLTRPVMPMGANYGDLDNDGWLDVYLGTGEPDFASLMPNVMYRNRQGRFEDVSFAGGFAHLQKGHGVAFGDVDNDGDQDLLHQLGGFYPGDAFGNALFENPGPAGNWITLRLQGRRSNRFGVGTRLEVRVREGEAKRSVYRVVGASGSFGGSSLQQEVGLGGAELIDELILRWPRTPEPQRFRNVEVNRVYRVVEGAAELVAVEVPVVSLGSPAGASGGSP